MSDFCDIYHLENLVNKATCFKNPTNPSCIDLILTNRKKSFQKTKIRETGISDHHSMTVTTLKTCLKKKSPKIITYRNYKSINTTTFKNELDTELKNINISNKHITYDLFKKCFMSIVNKHAPLKKRLIRANNAPFMDKNLSKSIMARSKLKNKFNKNPTIGNKISYQKQRNYCVKLLKQTRRTYYNNLQTTNIVDNKKFWTCVKPFFSEKPENTHNITLIEKTQ